MNFMKLLSWNVNGLRAVINKGFISWATNENADIICLQETKLSDKDFSLDLPDYNQYYSNAGKKGYSGTAVLCKNKPLKTTEGIGIEEHDKEGRTLTLEFESFFLVCVYVPNSQRGLSRLEYRRKWNIAFEEYIQKLDKIKPVIFTGDLNVAHNEIDIKNAKSNERSAGFTIEERDDFSRLLSRGFSDTFRALHPSEIKYSWWSYMFKAREKNIGWRIDYFIVSNRILNKVKEADIETNVSGSDHCPILLEIDL